MNRSGEWDEQLDAVVRDLEAARFAPNDDRKREHLIDAAQGLDRLAKLLRGDSSGREAVLAALVDAYPEPVDGPTLRFLSGIQEFARRVRELRVEEGYDIEANRGRYRLRSLTPNGDQAARWQTLNELRRRGGAAADRLRSMFVENVGQVFSHEDVVYVGKIDSAARRVRELRTEEGLRIESHKDNPNLKLGEYVLVDPQPIPTVERSVDAATRSRVLERDEHHCVVCGRGPDASRRIWLEVDHVVPLASGGGNEDDNLRTLCNDCHRARPH